jgi:hypothetical protein
MEERERLVVVENMLTILHQHRIHSLSAIRHQVRLEERERLIVMVQNMLTILPSTGFTASHPSSTR